MQNVASASETSKTSIIGESHFEDIAPFFDGAIASLMTSHDIPGAVITVVDRRGVVFSKGYGFADAGRNRPVDPKHTLFRPGSISKTITWTAVMQLVESGKLNLDEDVNQHLTQFQLPATFDAPITMKHLMAHSAGFEDGGAGYLFRRNAEQLKSLPKALEQHMPARVRPPGEVSSYSNWGTALAGLIVANISGMDFDTYVEKNIFTPLDMSSSTFREPVPAPLAARMSENLTRRAGEFTDGGFEFIHDFGPAGSLSSTADDMAKFMIAHLNDGAGILKPETARLMRTRLMEHHESIPGMLYGFIEERRNGRFAYGHGGDTVYFHSNMVMLPEAGVGIFVSFNAPGGGLAAREIMPAFFDRYFPHADEENPDPAENDNADDLTAYVGAYRNNRRAYTTWEKYSQMGNEITVSPSPKGGLLISSFYLSGARRFVPIGDNAFQSVDDPDAVVAFRTNRNGEATHLFQSPTPFSSYEKIGVLEQSSTHKNGLQGALIIFAGVVLGSIWSVRKWLTMSAGEKVARLLVFSSSAFYLGFVLIGMKTMSSLGYEVFFSGVPGLKWLLTLPVIALLLAAGAAAMVIPAWRGGYWSLLGRVRYTAVTILLLLFAVSLNYWNLLGPWYA